MTKELKTLVAILIVAVLLTTMIPATFGATRTETFPSAAGDEFVDVNNPHGNGNNFGFASTANVGADSDGEAGGTFARSFHGDAYADIDLGGTFDRTSTLTMSGKFKITGSNSPDNSIFLGYLGGDLLAGSHQFIGMMILEPLGAGLPFRLQAWIQQENENNPGGRIVSDSIFGNLGQEYTFDLTYTGQPDGSGMLSGFIAGEQVFQGPNPFVSAAAHSNTFDKFGIGAGFNFSESSTLTIDAYFDDLTYNISDAGQAGDFDSDGDVDGADFVAWQTNFPTPTGATLAEGDADGDGDVDGADFVVWQTNFPFTPGSGAVPVPEPSGFLIMSLALVGSIHLVRARRTREAAPAGSGGGAEEKLSTGFGGFPHGLPIRSAPR